jgi:hypothetical protein
MKIGIGVLEAVHISRALASTVYLCGRIGVEER